MSCKIIMTDEQIRNAIMRAEAKGKKQGISDAFKLIKKTWGDNDEAFIRVRKDAFEIWSADIINSKGDST